MNTYDIIKIKVEGLEKMLACAIEIGQGPLKTIKYMVNECMKEIDELSQKVGSLENDDQRHELYQKYLELASLDETIDLMLKAPVESSNNSSSSKASTSSAGQNKVSNHFLPIAQQRKQAMAQSFTNTTKTNADITKPSVIEAGPSSTNSNLSTIEMNPQNMSYNSGFYFSNVFEVPIAVPVAQNHANQLTETADLSNNGRIKQAIQANNPSNNNKNISEVPTAVAGTQNYANQPTEKENLSNNCLIKQPISSEQKAENSSNNNKNISEVPTAVAGTQNYANQSATPTIPEIITKLPPCIVCLEEPNEPISTDCGHLFCLACIKESLKKKSVCPMCNKTMTSKSYRRLYI